MLIQRPRVRGLQSWEVKRDRIGRVGSLAQKFMASQVILRELDEGLWGRLGPVWEDLWVEVLAQLLDPDCVLAGDGGD